MNYDSISCSNNGGEGMDFIKKSTLRENVTNSIRKAIVNNKIKPGERVIESKIAKKLGVSQSPVREALRELELMGLVENKPYCGCFVKKLTKKDIRDAYKLRTYLEMLAISEAVENIREEDLKSIDKLMKQMRLFAENGLKEEFIEMDIEFHKMIIHIANNYLLEKMWNMVNLGQWTFITAKISNKTLNELAERHESIFKSLKEGNVEEASMCMKKHIEELSEEIIMKIQTE